MNLRCVGRLLLIATSLFILGACSKSFSFQKGKVGNEIGESLKEPTPQDKSDRPQESGEGLPGYLFEPSAITAAVSQANIEIRGAPGAVRNMKGLPAATKLILIGAKLDEQDSSQMQDYLAITGRKIAEALSDSEGAFIIRGEVDPGETIFLKIDDDLPPETVSVALDKSTDNVILVEGSSGKIDKVDAPIATDLKKAYKASLVQRLKTTKNCDNCDLSGADFTGVGPIENCSALNADFRNAKLIASFFRQCNFSGSDFQGADFSNSDLYLVNFSKTKLINANFTNVFISEVNFLGADTTGVIGAEIPNAENVTINPRIQEVWE